MSAQPTEVHPVDLRERVQSLEPIPQGILESHLRDKIDQVSEFFLQEAGSQELEQYDVKRVYPDLWGLHAVTIMYAMASYKIKANSSPDDFS